MRLSAVEAELQAVHLKANNHARKECGGSISILRTIYIGHEMFERSQKLRKGRKLVKVKYSLGGR
jgi:hypothetical protein